LDSLEREYRREEDFCGSANASVNHVIGIILDHKNNREKFVLSRWIVLSDENVKLDVMPQLIHRHQEQKENFLKVYIFIALA
jgi:hypothetical protein